MAKKLYTGDFEINASTRMLYPYIHTPSGLSQWFADDVNINEDGIYIFEWEGDFHKAKLMAHRTNHYTKFEFLADEDDPSYFELRLELNELTQSVFIKVTDYSDFEDVEELHDLWTSLVENLKEIVGG